VIHVVNTSPAPLAGVQLNDLLPWQVSTYQRDAVASSGSVISDIVSLGWTGDINPFSEELITLTVLVDPWYQGALTNTAYISHTSLLDDVAVRAVAYITQDPVLRITKTASPSPVYSGSDLLYTLLVSNLGQQATELVVTDTLPATPPLSRTAPAKRSILNEPGALGVSCLAGRRAAGAHLRVRVSSFDDIVNSAYRVSSAEGARCGRARYRKVLGLLKYTCR
jgi:uncharacterized repeat protein (TIGR01451 family)